jgi:hypothetical protein
VQKEKTVAATEVKAPVKKTEKKVSVAKLKSAPASEYELAQAKVKAKQDDAAAEETAEGAEGAEGEEAPKGEKKDESDTNPYILDGGNDRSWGRRDKIENAHDLNFGEDDEVKNHPKYKKMMDQFLGRDYVPDENKSRYNWRSDGYFNRGSGWGGVQRYDFDGHGGKKDNDWGRGFGYGVNLPKPDGEEAAENRYGYWGNYERREGWEGKGNKHGEYGEDFDPLADEDGDDKELEGYYPDSHETEQKEYLNDLYRNDYRPHWDRAQNWRYRNPYSEEDAGAGNATASADGEAAEGGEEAAADEAAPEGEAASADAEEPAESAAQISASDKAEEQKGFAQMAAYKFTQDPEPSPEDLRLAEEVLDVDVKKYAKDPKP